MSIQLFEQAWQLMAICCYAKQNSFALKIACAFLLLLGAYDLGFSQDPPSSFDLTPAEFEHGDIISLKISYGTSAFPASDITSLSFVYACDGFLIDEKSTLSLDLSNSWFSMNENWSGTLHSNEGRDTLYVGLTRTDGIPVGGYGWVATGGGILVDIEDIIGKSGKLPGLRLVRVKEIRGLSSELHVFPNPGNDRIFIQGPDSGGEVDISLINSRGNAVFSQRTSLKGGVSLDVSGYASGLYIVRVQGTQKYWNKKIIIRK